MNLEFDKLDGCGNDFVFINNLDGNISLDAQQVEHLCDRHFGIGADGVILVEQPRTEGCDAFMNYINSDGTLAQMCGNGVRCFAKFLVDRKIIDPASGSFVADTLAGPRPISFTVDSEDKLRTATVDMGEPILEPSQVPAKVKANAKTASGIPYAQNVPISSPWGDYAFTLVSMGNPHAVCFIEDFNEFPDELFTDASDKSLETLDIDRIGAYYESAEVFPEKINVEFAHVTEPGIKMRVYERGCGETLACGTGACATLVAGALTGRSGRQNDVMLKGGTLSIDWDANDHVMMTGPAEQTFKGTVSV